MDTTFKRALGAKTSTKTDYRTVPYSLVKSTAPFGNNVQAFSNDYSMIPVIDQGMEPECVECAQKTFTQQKIYRATGQIVDISTRAAYQIARMYSTDETDEGSEPFYADAMARDAGFIGTALVPEDRTLDPVTYGAPLDITLEMVADAVKKQIAGVATPNVNLVEFMNAVQNDGGFMVTILIDESWYSYVPGKSELTGAGAILGLHRVVITGFHVNPDGTLWFHGRNSWGTEWGIGGDFEFNTALYLAKMSEPSVYTEIPAQLLTTIHNQPQKPVYAFSQPFSQGTTSPDVVAWQNILKYEGLLSLGVPSTGTYAALTTAATLAFQERYAVAGYDTLDTLDGKNVGPATIAKANELYAPAYRPKIVQWALAAQRHEGYFAPGQNAACPNGSLSWRNNNPGNFKYATQPNATDSAGWACFDTYEHGFDYLCTVLANAATGGTENTSQNYSTMTLLQFYAVYSPDGTSAAYAAAIAAATGVSVDSPISVFVN